MSDDRGWEESCIRDKMAEGWSEEKARAYCWGAKARAEFPCLFADDEGVTFAETVRHHVALYGEGDGERVARAVWAQLIEHVHNDHLKTDAATFLRTLDAVADALGLPIPATRPAAWVHKCIRDKMADGWTKEHAAKYCYGAWYHKSRSVVTLRDEPKGILHGYIAIWGSPKQRDAFGTWFDRGSPPEMALDFLPFPYMYNHTDDPQLRKKIIGEVFKVGVDDTGVWYLAQLDKKRLTDNQFGRIVDEVRRGELATSSASAEHLAEFDEDGRFVNWIISEVSVTKAPAEERMPAVTLLRSKRDIYDVIQPQAASEEPGTAAGAADTSTVTQPPNGEPTMELKDMLTEEAMNAGLSAADILDALIAEYGMEQVQELIAQMAAPAEGETEETEMLSAPPLLAELKAELDKRVAVAKAAALAERVEALERARQTEPPAPQTNGVPGGVTRGSTPGNGATPRIRDVHDLRYHRLTAEDLALGYRLLNAIPHHLRHTPVTAPVVSEPYMRAMAHKVLEQHERRPKEFPYLNEMIYTRSFPWARADELMGSDVSSAGDDWVGVLYETQLWEKTRQGLIYQDALNKGMQEREVPQGVESISIPTEGTDPVVYVVPQTDDVLAATNLPDATGFTISTPGTGSASLTVNKVGIYNAWTGEFEEDSLIPVLADLRRRQNTAAQEAVEYILLRGDTTTTASTNINDIAGTPAGTERFLHSNGWLKRALVTQTANSRSASGTLDEDDYQKLFALMGTNGIEATNPDLLMFVVDNFTYWATERLVSIKTDDVRASGGTLTNGRLTQMWGVDLHRSGQMVKVNNAGKYDDDTAANDAYGLICCVRPDKWTVGWKRRVTTEVTRYSEADASTIVTWMRFGQQGFDNELVAVTYYVGV